MTNPAILTTDILVQDHGTVLLFKPCTEEARLWVKDHVHGGFPFGQWTAGDRRETESMLSGAQADGLVVGAFEPCPAAGGGA